MSKLFDGMLLSVENPVKVFLKRPNGVPLVDEKGVPAFISVMSTDSAKANALQQAARDKRLNGDKMTAASNDIQAAELLAALSTDWYLVRLDGKPLTGDDGQPLPFSQANAKVLYLEPGAQFWKEQVQSAAGERANFMPGAATP